MDTNPSRLDDLMLNDRGFAFDPNTGESYQLSGSGIRCLRALQQGATVAGLLADLTATYEVEPLAARWDLDAFLWEIKQLGWL